MHDNERLAQFIVSLGSLNGYGATVADTKRAIDAGDARLLPDENDAIILRDALNGINAIKRHGFDVDGIIAINSQFKSGGDEQPRLPGHLRNANYNVDDNVSIILDETTQEAYFAPEVVTKADLQVIVDEWGASEQEGKDAWRIFARLSKLQPFQDGNKRTALIAANAAIGSLDSENYLLIPTNMAQRYIFTGYLMTFYAAKSVQDEDIAFARLLETVNQQQLTLSVFENVPQRFGDVKTRTVD